MSFRARLTTFFVLIVVIPMTAMGLLGLALINNSATGKADSRAAGIAVTTAGAYRSASREASLDARAVARALARTSAASFHARAAALLSETGLTRIDAHLGNRTAVSVGARDAIAPGIAVVRAAAHRPRLVVSVSAVTADQFARGLAGDQSAIVVRSGARTLGTSLTDAGGSRLPARRGTVRISGRGYQAITQRFEGFAGSSVDVSALSALSATAQSVNTDRMIAAGFIIGLLLLAFFFTLLLSRSLQAQVTQFLDAARRLGDGDFSSPIPTVGRDEFAALGDEFNAMSTQLRDRLGDLENERARFRAAIRRIGEAFASGLDRDALLALALRTAIDAVEADRGRVSARARPSDPLIDTDHIGSLAGLQTALLEAEHHARDEGGVGLARSGEVHVAAVSLGAMEGDGPPHGVITVCRDGKPFGPDDLELLRSLAIRATLALANVNMHIDVARQAVTDDLTGLASHGHFQELLETELHGSCRYGYPVAIAMFDIDNFKSVNDTHGHPQGDLVLRRVADALRDTSRDADISARYGGEEMALILPHTDIDGAYEIAERVRTAIAGMAVPRLDHQGWLKVTASVGVAASFDGDRETLVAAADEALYAAKRSGKNRTVRAGSTATESDAARDLARATSGGLDE